MVNLSNVIHTSMWNAPNEQDTSTIGLVVGIGTDASIYVEDLVLRHNK
jgi:hypothetical protein